MDVADFLHLETAFQANCIVDAATDEEYIFRICLFCRKPLDPFFIVQNPVNLVWNSLEFFDINGILFI